MATLTISLTSEQLEQLQNTAERLGIGAEDLARAGVAAVLREPEDAFQRALEHVIEKNADLYRRLA